MPPNFRVLPVPLFGEPDGYDNEGYDVNGFGRDGFNADGYDVNGFGRDGFNADGYDAKGGNAEGYDADGNPKNVDAEDLDLAVLWGEFTRAHSRFNRQRPLEFLAYLRTITRDPDTIDQVKFCDHCGAPEWKDLTSFARGNEDRLICESCYDSWSDCGHCEDRYPNSELTTVLSGSSVCDGCRSESYTFCHSCAGYYHDEDVSDHDHFVAASSCCTSPQLQFTIRNDGCEPLANDTRAVIELPSGTISAEGLDGIRNYLQHQQSYDDPSYSFRTLSFDLEQLGSEWQTRNGNYAKRLSSLAYKTYKLKLSSAVMSQIGVIAREHSNPISVAVEVTRDLNLSAAEFYHEDSCWWNGYNESRCALKTNGGFGLRTFNSDDEVTGRAWVLPLRNRYGRLVPTFNTITPNAFVIFNGYGDLGMYSAPRILAHMAGWTYRKIDFCCSPMYVNAGGYLIAPEAVTKQRGELDLSVIRHARLFNDEQEKEASNVAP